MEELKRICSGRSSRSSSIGSNTEMEDLLRAKAKLNSDLSLSCVFIKGETEICDRERGIKPLLKRVENLKGFSAADKIVGRAAALLYALAKIKEVYGKVISKEAKEIFSRFQIPFSFETETEFIVNRRGDGLCPMEETVKGVLDPALAYRLLEEKVKSLNSVEIPRKNF